MRRPAERLADILSAIDRIQQVVERGEAAYRHDELLRVWVYHHLVVIGEACANLPREVRIANPGVPWGKIIATRNRVVHAYFDADADAIWRIATEDLRALRAQIIEALDDLPGDR